ncbi:transcriptional regulator [Luteimicrobium album]|uniref:Transcriptional regulator n=1 Tax=Luteimicrobium album TaxID=1054550 RepID=A0ABQ6I695_9MICO|nr:YafY family protein [Luteimicrobium album]GMA25478.1 transcriptional regulator [Luteimicrobium album]
MRRSERHHALVDHLRARAPHPVSAARLARELEVSTRTIERDVVALQAAGVPLFAVPGRTGGYSVVPEYSLPPLHLTPEEAFACAVALDLLDGSPFAAAARRARDKVGAGLPASTRETLRRVAPDVRSIASAEARHDASGVDGLARAVTERRVLRLEYRDGAGATTQRTVEPLALLEADGAWYLAGWCRTRDAVRGFRTDRIVCVERTDEVLSVERARELDADLARWRPRAVGRT